MRLLVVAWRLDDAPGERRTVLDEGAGRGRRGAGQGARDDRPQGRTLGSWREQAEGEEVEVGSDLAADLELTLAIREGENRFVLDWTTGY